MTQSLRLAQALFLLLAALSFIGCDKSPPEPGQEAYQAANGKLGSFDGKAGFGSSDAAASVAEKFAARAKALDGELFSGGESKFDDATTKGNFLTYVQDGEKAVVILVRVPALKNYEGDDRKSLMEEILWVAAQETAKDLAKDKEVIVAARGALTYGGIAKGKLGGKPSVEMGAAVPEKPLYAHFVVGGAAPAKAEEAK
ncbi:MAG: hypothetical protein R3B72_50390 [Polyangiaceae bacterium]